MTTETIITETLIIEVTSYARGSVATVIEGMFTGGSRNVGAEGC